jgi:hypothetical protein
MPRKCKEVHLPKVNLSFLQWLAAEAKLQEINWLSARASSLWS